MLVPSIRTSRLELISWSLPFMRAAIQDDPQRQALAGYQLPEQFPGDLNGLLKRRLTQLERDPLEQAFLVRSIVFDGHMIGAIGFHAKPSFAGKLEVGYRIFPEFRRKGFALEAVTGLLEWGKLEPGVRTFVASVSPSNLASLALIAKLGFVQVGRQWDDEDGEELVFEVPAALALSS
jgi:[ribosomal protein S5]-alanine N-acetyltransferase